MPIGPVSLRSRESPALEVCFDYLRFAEIRLRCFAEKLLGDFVGPFVAGLPLAVILGLFTPLGIYGVFIARAMEEFAKIAVFSWRGRRLNWDAIAEKHNMLNPLGDDPAEGLIQK